MCFLEACATWLPGRGRSASLHPGPEPGFICSRKGLVAQLCCPLRGKGSSGLPAKGGGEGLRGWGKDPGLGQEAQGRGLLAFCPNLSIYAERSSYSAVPPSPHRGPGRVTGPCVVSAHLMLAIAVVMQTIVFVYFFLFGSVLIGSIKSSQGLRPYRVCDLHSCRGLWQKFLLLSGWMSKPLPARPPCRPVASRWP